MLKYGFECYCILWTEVPEIFASFIDHSKLLCLQHA